MRPFDDVRRVLGDREDDTPDGVVRSDLTRNQRTGSPEVIYAARKTVPQIIAGIETLIAVNGRVVISQIPDRLALSEALPHGISLHIGDDARSGVAVRGNATRVSSGGKVAVLTAGTSDIPAAAEAALVASEMGCDVRSTWDVGVAGIHRLVRPLEEMIAWEADVFVVAAGMDGILPTIVSGLVPQPVIGLPVSTGYGFGGEGLGALTTMLQTCSPGLVVVNIDNGVGAGMTAGRIANRCALARAGQQ
jgi:NCAIR mutase (PurE)-related protein